LKNEDEFIVSSPTPFLYRDYKTENEQRDLARFQDAMPFEDLIEGLPICSFRKMEYLQ
jgi:tRNA1Val (adenine37-N6)-methyltransferase